MYSQLPASHWKYAGQLESKVATTHSNMRAEEAEGATLYDSVILLGEGTFGEVTVDPDDPSTVIKRISHDKIAGVDSSAVREINVLSTYTHPFMVPFRNFSIEMTSTNLSLYRLATFNPRAKWIYDNSDGRLVTVRRIMCQLLDVVRALHQVGLMHRDIKPDNILINSSTNDVYLCDYGGATWNKEDRLEDFTSLATTLWYRAPEALFETRTHSPAMDIWSLGAIYAELLLGSPIFAAKNEGAYYVQMQNQLGQPDRYVYDRWVSSSNENANTLQEHFPFSPKKRRRRTEEVSISVWSIMMPSSSTSSLSLTTSSSTSSTTSLSMPTSSSSMSSSTTRGELIETLNEQHVPQQDIEVVLRMLHYDSDQRPSATDVLKWIDPTYQYVELTRKPVSVPPFQMSLQPMRRRILSQLVHKYYRSLELSVELLHMWSVVVGIVLYDRICSLTPVFTNDSDAIKVAMACFRVASKMDRGCCLLPDSMLPESIWLESEVLSAVGGQLCVEEISTQVSMFRVGDDGTSFLSRYNQRDDNDNDDDNEQKRDDDDNEQIQDDGSYNQDAIQHYYYGLPAVMCCDAWNRNPQKILQVYKTLCISKSKDITPETLLETDDAIDIMTAIGEIIQQTTKS